MRKALHLHARASAYHGASALFMAVILILAASDPWRSIYNTYATHYWEGNVDYYRYTQNYSEKPALIFIPSSEYFYVAFENPPSDHAPVIYARDFGANNILLMRYFPYRNVYLMSRGLLKPITRPDELCNTISPAPLTLPGMLMPSNILLQQSLCGKRLLERF